jgi:hypothetical protein
VSYARDRFPFTHNVRAVTRIRGHDFAVLDQQRHAALPLVAFADAPAVQYTKGTGLGAWWIKEKVN